MKYAEMNDIIYRAKDDKHFTERLIGGKWTGNGVIMSKVARDGMLLEEDEAKALAGDEWPAEGAEKEPLSARTGGGADHRDR